MEQISGEKSLDFPHALIACGRASEIPEAEDVYGWLMGSWALEVHDYQPDGTVRRSNGEVHFARVLEGRAVQDVWIMPRPAERGPDLPKAGNRYGTTLRIWDPAISAWRITWINPVTGDRDELVGRKSGNNIVQIGVNHDDTPIRWNFSEIAPDSFRWTGEFLLPDGKTWKLENEFRAKRLKEIDR